MCAGAYRPVLSEKGKLVKSREPAWSMMEQTRDPGCLQEQFRALGKLYQTGYQHHGDSRKACPGYPDVHLWTPRRPDGGGSAFVELKRMRSGAADDPSPDQVRVMSELIDAGHPVYLARPCCLLTGTADELFAALAGRPCRYFKRTGRPAAPRGLEEPPAATRARGAAPTPRPRPATTLPGTDPVPPPIPGAVSYEVPLPTDDHAAAAVRDLEAWLRAAGFPAAAVPFPLRIVVGPDAIAVHVRAGRPHPGGVTRVWRGGASATGFPPHLIARTRARTTPGDLREQETSPRTGGEETVRC